MKKVYLFLFLVLSACGTIGIGSNHETILYNNSQDIITVHADSGVYVIKPEQEKKIYSYNDLTIKNKNINCPELRVMRKLNASAAILDIFPGFIIGIIPVFIDAVSNNLYKMPATYSYQCVY